VRTEAGLNPEPFERRLLERTRAAGLADTPSGPVSQFFGYFTLLKRWNSRVNLTALPLTDDPKAETLDRLFVESLSAVRHVPRDMQGVWFDFGSGGGSPAIPLKVICPWLSLTMVESRAKKAAFLREAIRVTAIVGAAVNEVRVEALLGAHAKGSVDLITIRGVRLDDMVFSVAAHLLHRGGRLMLFGTDTEHPWDETLFRLLAKESLPGLSRLFVLERA
jgi:16S rRNA (guanine527-N7)-methyltransferase